MSILVFFESNHTLMSLSLKKSFELKPKNEYLLFTER